MSSTDFREQELTLGQQQDITDILENYRNNPSNSNKYRFELFAYINDTVIGNLVKLHEAEVERYRVIIEDAASQLHRHGHTYDADAVRNRCAAITPKGGDKK